jgi:hypothetical protein
MSSEVIDTFNTFDQTSRNDEPEDKDWSIPSKKAPDRISDYTQQDNLPNEIQLISIDNPTTNFDKSFILDMFVYVIIILLLIILLIHFFTPAKTTQYNKF